MNVSIKVRKGGAFRLNLHPKTFFDGNPYKSDKRKHLIFTCFFTVVFVNVKHRLENGCSLGQEVVHP